MSVELGESSSPARRWLAGIGGGGSVGFAWALEQFFSWQKSTAAAALKAAQDVGNQEVVRGLMDLLRSCQDG